MSASRSLASRWRAAASCAVKSGQLDRGFGRQLRFRHEMHELARQRRDSRRVAICYYDTRAVYPQSRR